MLCVLKRAYRLSLVDVESEYLCAEDVTRDYYKAVIKGMPTGGVASYFLGTLQARGAEVADRREVR